jgi:hypothetical protein
MTLVSQMSTIAKAKVMAIEAVIKELRPHLMGIEITAEESFSFKAPPGFNWSKTNDPKVAIHNATRRLHVITPPGSSSDVFFYK